MFECHQSATSTSLFLNLPICFPFFQSEYIGSLTCLVYWKLFSPWIRYSRVGCIKHSCYNRKTCVVAYVLTTTYELTSLPSLLTAWSDTNKRRKLWKNLTFICSSSSLLPALKSCQAKKQKRWRILGSHAFPPHQTHVSASGEIWNATLTFN